MTLYHEPPPLRPLPHLQVRSDPRESWPPSSHSQVPDSRDDRSAYLVQQYPTRSVSPMSREYGSNGIYETDSFLPPPARVSTSNYPHQERYQPRRPAPPQLSSPQIFTYDPSMYGQVHSHRQPDHPHRYSRHHGGDIAAPVSTNEEVKPQQSFYEKQDSYRQEPFRYIGNTSRQSPPPDTIPRQQHAHNHDNYRNDQPSQYGDEATYHDQRGPTSQRHENYNYDDGRDRSSSDETERGAPENQPIHYPRPPPYDFDEHGHRVFGYDGRQYEQGSYNKARYSNPNRLSRRESVDTLHRRDPVEPSYSDCQSFRPARRNLEPIRPGGYNPEDCGGQSVQSGFGRDARNEAWLHQSRSGYLHDRSPRDNDSGLIPRGSYREDPPPSSPASITSHRSGCTSQHLRQPQEAQRLPARSVKYSRSPQRPYRSPTSSFGAHSRRSSPRPSSSVQSMSRQNNPRRITIIHISGASDEDGWDSRVYSGPSLDLSPSEVRGACGYNMTRGQDQISELMSLVKSLD